jgi:hypothetical protein
VSILRDADEGSVMHGRLRDVQGSRLGADEVPMRWERLTNAELLELSGQALIELRRSGIVRTGNAPAGDLAERLVADAMNGELAPNSQKSWDVIAPLASPGPWRRIQVKARVVSDLHNPGQRQVSAFRSWDCEAVMFVLFDPVYRARRASLVGTQIVREHAQRADFTASDRVFANDVLLNLGESWTERLQCVRLWTRLGDVAIDGDAAAA